MNHLIVDSAPKGSAILAYGRARGPRLNRRLMAWLAMGAVVVGLAIFAAMSTKLTLIVPRDRLALAALRPRDAYGRLSTDLRQSLPAPWRAAFETRSRFPVLLGVALDGQDGPHAFALVARTGPVTPSTELRVHDEGAYRLLTDATALELERVPFRPAWNLTRRARRHTLAWTIDGALLARVAGSDATNVADAAGEITGVWDGRRGDIAVSPAADPAPLAGRGGVNDGEPLDSPLFAILGGGVDALPALAAITSQGIDLRSVTIPLTRLAFDPQNNSAVFIEWGARLPNSDLLHIRAALGASESRDYLLVDQSVARELIPSSATLTVPFLLPMRQDASSTWEITDSALKPKDLNLQSLPPDPACPGKVRFLLQGSAMRNLLSVWKMPENWKNMVNSLKISQVEGGVAVCVN